MTTCLQVIEGREQVDWKRHGVFVTFGFFYLVSTWRRRSSSSTLLLVVGLCVLVSITQPPGRPAQQHQGLAAHTMRRFSAATDPHCGGLHCVAQGGFQYYLYNHLFVKWCAGMTNALGHMGSAPIKTFIDQGIQ